MATVLSTTSGMPYSCATLAMPSMSRMSFFGFAIVSPKNALVLGRIAAFHCSRSSGSSTNETSMPSFGNV